MNVEQLIMEAFERLCCMRGYHIFQEVWTAAVGEELVCETIVALVSGSLREATTFFRKYGRQQLAKS